MGLFDRSKQVTTTTTNISSTEETNTTNIQDSGNVITSITDAFKTNISGFDTFISQPIGIQAGGASGGGSFDMNRFFDSANSVASAGTPGGNIAGTIKSVVPWIVIAVAVYLGFKFLRK